MGFSRGTTQDPLWVCSGDDKKTYISSHSRTNKELRTSEWILYEFPEEDNNKKHYIYNSPQGRKKEPSHVPHRDS